MASTTPTAKRPNFLVILTDDMGYSDLGCFGGEIHTPNIDSIALSGTRLTDFHTAATCSPSRSMLMTGTDHHIAGIGNMVEWLSGAFAKNAGRGGPDVRLQRGRPGYEGFLNDRVVTVAEVLRDEGYQTLMSGKWHLGLRPERAPHARGFERSFAHLPACSNHYAYEPQLAATASVYVQRSHRSLHDEDGKYVMDLPKGWYSTDGYTDKLLGYLDDRETTKDERPFFAYLAYTAPHWPLQAPQDIIKLYKGKYDDGPAALRERRLARMAELGLIDPAHEPHPMLPLSETPWSSMTAEERANSSRAMEVYAAMLHCVDLALGRVLAKLAAQGELDNTFIMLASDNGPDGTAYEAYPVIQTRLNEHVKTPGYFDHSLSNLGNYNSFIWYGSAWAQASSAPHRLFKAYSTEGGVRVPAIIRFPKAVQEQRAAAAPDPSMKSTAQGAISDVFTTIMDITPTLLALAHAPHPHPTYKGRAIAPLRGKSMLPWATGASTRVHAEDFVQGWELGGRAALRKGRWKMNFVPKPAGPGRWELHDLGADRGEVRDLAGERPEKVEELMGEWARWMEECNVIGVVPELVGMGRTVVVDEGGARERERVLGEGEGEEWRVLGQPLEEQMTTQGWIEYTWEKDGAKEHPERFTFEPPVLGKA